MTTLLMKSSRKLVKGDGKKNMETEKHSESVMGNLISEIWKDVKGFDGYEISNLGNIKRNGRLLKLSAWNQYKTIRLRTESNEKTVYIHRLVAMAFIPNPENKPMINHIDGNKLNNTVSNLEWCTRQENEIHAWKHGLKERIRETAKENLKIARMHVHTKKPVTQMTLDGKVIKLWDSASDVMKEIGIDASGITKCCKGKLKKTGGYKWQYTE